MDEQNFINIIKVYDSFKNELKEKINSQIMVLNNYDYYLICEEYLNELEQNIENYNKYKNIKTIIFKQKPKIIENFSELISYLKNNKQIRLIRRDLFELINKSFKLNKSNIVQYFGLKGKIIIEFKSNEKNAILFINPFNKTFLKENIFIIKKNNNQKNFYQELLSKSDEYFKSLDNNKNIIPLEKYENKIININLIQKENNDFPKDLLKTFIYIFYYEKTLDKLKEKFFNEKQKYYFVEPDWLNKYKSFYNYESICNILNNIYRSYLNINYSNLDKYINNMLDFVLKETKLKFDNKELPKELTENKSISFFLIMKFNIKFIKIAMIIPSKIMTLILKWNKNILIFPKDILYKEKFIYYFNKPNIIVGNLNDNNLFFPKYIFSYGSNKIFELEKSILLSNSIKDYITLRNCIENHINKLQIMKHEKNEEIGKFINYLKNLNNRFNESERNSLNYYNQSTITLRNSNIKNKQLDITPNKSINNITYNNQTEKIKKSINPFQPISRPITPMSKINNLKKVIYINGKNLFGEKLKINKVLKIFLLKINFLLKKNIKHLQIKSLINILNITYSQKKLEKNFERKILDIKEEYNIKNNELINRKIKEKEDDLVNTIKNYQRQIENLNKEKENNILNEIKKIKEQFEFSLFQITNNNKNKMNKLNVELLEYMNNEKIYKDEDFKDLKPISKGSYGMVYSAYSLKDYKEICLKKINIDEMKIDYEKSQFPENSYKKDLNNEIKILKLLSLYNNSIKYYGNYDKDNEKIIVMEKCDENLYEFIKKNGKMKIEEIKRNFISLNEIFKVMQEYNIIHRDLKLSNFLIKYTNKEKREYIIKLSDYGIGKFSNDYNFSGIKGTLETIAPEILLKKINKYESIVDIFSLGVILYQLSHNLKHPFKKYEFEEFVKKYIINYEIDNLYIEFNRDIDNKDFKDLITKMIKLNPKHRLTWAQYFDHPFFK